MIWVVGYRFFRALLTLLYVVPSFMLLPRKLYERIVPARLHCNYNFHPHVVTVHSVGYGEHRCVYCNARVEYGL